MFLKGRLQWSLLAITITSGILSLVFAQRGDESSPPTTTAAVAVTTVPPTTTIYVAPVRYIVQSGDSLFAIASKYMLDMKALMEMNGITNSDHVEAGQELIFPPATGFVPVAPSTTMKP